MKNYLSSHLNLQFIPGPVMIPKGSGIQDHLDGVQKPTTVPHQHSPREFIHSLAKWKRTVLTNEPLISGILTDTHACRKDENVDCYHDIYVDQWDWEIKIGNRNIDTLKQAAKNVWQCIYLTAKALNVNVPEDLTFEYANTLQEMYPFLTPKEREYEYAKRYGPLFLLNISSDTHEPRAPDYDDWHLNGDIIVYDSVNDDALELSSMGIRVDSATADKQLQSFYSQSVYEDMKRKGFIQNLLQGKLSQTLGGGIGKSRVALYLSGCDSIQVFRSQLELD